MSETAVLVPTKMLQQRLRGADPGLVRVLERFIRQLDEQRTARGRTRDEVSKLLAKDLPDNPTAGHIAGLMAINERTLRRKLAAENTNFAALLDDVRRRLAMAYLEEGDSAIRNISERLGYYDPSAFNKAFKRWTGHSPRGFKTRA